MSNTSKLLNFTQRDDTIQDLYLVQPQTYYDNRGENVETFCAKHYKMMFSSIDVFRGNIAKDVPPLSFVVDSVSVSQKNVLRGMHGDNTTWKLVQCLKGSIYLAVLDLRKNSSTYKTWNSFYINEKNRHQVLIPAGCVNGHVCLSDECIFHYKLTNDYVAVEDQISIPWDDPEYGVYWPINKTNVILSRRDNM
jgi:dTDP-4-dehydrorhamnose 3,5-epimerase